MIYLSILSFFSSFSILSFFSHYVPHFLLISLLLSFLCVFFVSSFWKQTAARQTKFGGSLGDLSSSSNSPTPVIISPHGSRPNSPGSASSHFNLQQTSLSLAAAVAAPSSNVKPMLDEAEVEWLKSRLKSEIGFYQPPAPIQRPLILPASGSAGAVWRWRRNEHVVNCFSSRQFLQWGVRSSICKIQQRYKESVRNVCSRQLQLLIEFVCIFC